MIKDTKDGKGKKSSKPPTKALAKEAKKEALQSVRGMHDVLPQDMPWWDRIRSVVEKLAGDFNYSRIETPMLEYAEVFERGVGVHTEIIEKEMYMFRGKGGDHLALRPEGTAPIVRAYLEHGLGKLGQPVKLYYEGPFFRHDRPQAGRLRQFTQAGFEVLGGPNDPVYDAQLIVLAHTLLTDLRIARAGLRVNSIGCRICRPVYIKQLQTYYRRHEKKLSRECALRISLNPLRLLDCKHEECTPFKEHAPSFLDKLCLVCSRHLKGLLEYLDEMKLEYAVDHRLVRGLDYYSRTVFEFEIEGASWGALISGGRYDYLFESLGGRLTPAVGFAAGYERMILAMKEQGVLPSAGRGGKRVFVVYVGDLAKQKALGFVQILRAEGVGTLEAFGKESLKAQLRAADKSGASLALILGQKEIHEERVIIRDLSTGVQEVVLMERVVPEVKRRLRRA